MLISLHCHGTKLCLKLKKALKVMEMMEVVKWTPEICMEMTSLGTEGDGEELECGSEVDPGDFKGDSLRTRYLKLNKDIEENTQLSVAGMQSEIQEALECDPTTPMGAEVNQGS